jgi:toxin-antitoxin system PIN domain toxin
VLVYAGWPGAERHDAYRTWLTEVVRSDAAFGVAELVLSAVVRVATNPRVLTPPAPLDAVLAFVDGLRSRPNAVVVAPGSRHWSIFTSLCRAVGARGNLVTDAYHAALAIETGSEWITTDRDYARFPGLRWRHPLD